MGYLASQVSPESLKQLVGSVDCPAIVDVRRRAAYDDSPRAIAAAQWRDHPRAEDWAASLPPDQAVVVYCVHGHEVSQSAAALLRACGRRAAYLEGGFEGFAAVGGITIDKGGLPAPGPGSLWAIDADVAVDRLACPWLIRRFVDPQARFLEVASARLEAVATEVDAISCEAVPAGSPQAADGGRFEALLARFGIEAPALERLAAIVRGAGAGQADAAPESAGLRAISLGMKAVQGTSLPGDERGLAIYDALFAKLRHAGGRE